MVGIPNPDFSIRRRGGERVADDDRSIRTVLTQALGRAGYQVRSASNAATLWHWIEEGEGDLVITDVVMPDENGLDLIPRIKKLRPDMRVIVMSAQSTLMTAVKATQRGAFEYLPKPFDVDNAVELIRRAMNENQVAEATVEVHDAAPEMALPQTVCHDPRGEWVAGAGNPVREHRAPQRRPRDLDVLDAKRVALVVWAGRELAQFADRKNRAAFASGAPEPKALPTTSRATTSRATTLSTVRPGRAAAAWRPSGRPARGRRKHGAS